MAKERAETSISCLTLIIPKPQSKSQLISRSTCCAYGSSKAQFRSSCISNATPRFSSISDDPGGDCFGLEGSFA